MHLSALHHVGSPLDLTTMAKRVGVASLSVVPETNDSFQQSLAEFSSEPSSSTDGPLPPPGEAIATGQDALSSLTPKQQSSLTQDAPYSSASTDADSMVSTVKGYTSASQDTSQAYQEYAKAWGGRVVHGQVELPPLSIYLE